MRNPARLAAELSGRPLLLRETAVAPLARALMLADSDGHQARTPFARLLGQARRLVSVNDAPDTPSAPSCYAPRWLGEPDDMGFGWTLKDGVACIEICGPLMAHGFGWGDDWYHGYDTLALAYEEMGADARVRAIFEVVQSPGGVVDPGLPELAAQKRSIRASAGGKPIWSYVRAAYSAGFWLTSGSDRRLGARECGVGSIGAVVTHCDMSGALENDGIKIRSFKFGKRKTDGSPFEPLSETAEASLQAEIDQCGRWFVEDVLAGIPALTEEAVLATEAGCYFGDSDDPALSGLSHGLIDAVSSERQAFADLVALVAGQTSSPPAAPSGAAPAAAKETDMKRSTVMAALKRAGLKGSQLKKVEDELPEDEAEGDDDETPAAEDDEDETPAAKGDDQDGTAEDDDDDTPAAKGDDEDETAEDDDDGEVNAKTARAILALPQAKGREKLAQNLAFSPGMTVRKASRLLSDAPRGDSLASRMNGRDPSLSGSGGGGSAARGGNKADNRLVEAARARAEKAKGSRPR